MFVSDQVRRRRISLGAVIYVVSEKFSVKGCYELTAVIGGWKGTVNSEFPKILRI